MQWGIRTGLSIGLLFGTIALLGYWISPMDYARHVPLAAPLALTAFLVLGGMLGFAFGAARPALRSRLTAAAIAFVVATPFSAAALVAAHGASYLSRGAHWLVICLFALAAPAMASTYWPDND